MPLRDDPYALLENTTVFRVSDQASVRFGDLWARDQACVVFWARSMGCPFCWELSIKLHTDIIPQLGNDIPLFLVSIGTPQRGIDFVAKTGFPADRLLADPTSATYAALNLKKGVVDTFFNPQTPLALAKRAAQGDLGVLQKQVLPQWEPWQPPQQDQVQPCSQVIQRCGHVMHILQTTSSLQALQQGGVVVFAGHRGTWAHFDPATSVHADLDEVVQEAQRAQRTLCAMPRT